MKLPTGNIPPQLVPAAYIYCVGFVGIIVFHAVHDLWGLLT